MSKAEEVEERRKRRKKERKERGKKEERAKVNGNNYQVNTKISFLGTPEGGEKQRTERKKDNREPSGSKVSFNNGQLRLQPPPWLVPESRLERKATGVDILQYAPISIIVIIFYVVDHLKTLKFDDEFLNLHKRNDCHIINICCC